MLHLKTYMKDNAFFWLQFCIRKLQHFRNNHIMTEFGIVPTYFQIPDMSSRQELFCDGVIKRRIYTRHQKLSTARIFS